MNAREIALKAHEQELEAVEAERQLEAERQQEEDRKKRERLKDAFEAALPKLNEWFPGVEWTWVLYGNFENDCIVWDSSETWSPSFKLRVQRFITDMNAPESGYRIVIEVGDYVQDTSMTGYSYFSGVKVNSAADIGRYLVAKKKNR
jgi:hypothetical protein